MCLVGHDILKTVLSISAALTATAVARTSGSILDHMLVGMVPSYVVFSRHHYI